MNSITMHSRSFAQISQNWEDLSLEDRIDFFRQLDNANRQDLFSQLNAMDKACLIKQMTPDEQRLWLRVLNLDDTADLIQELPIEEREALIELLDPTSRVHLRALLAYKEDVAGGLMNPRYVRVRPDMDVAEAVRYVHKQALGRVETMYYVYVLGPEQKLLGMLSFRELFTANPASKVSLVMKTQLISARENMDQEELGKLFSQYGLLAIPVIDDENRMKGIVTIDDIVDVVQEEATEDIQKGAAVEAFDTPYLQTGLLEMISKRAGWLTVLFLGEMLTASAMGFYQNELAKAVVLALFLPLIISSGGNAGSQASTLVIRAMALGQVRLKDWMRIAGRELSIGLGLGLILASIGFARVITWQAVFHTYGPEFFPLALTVFLSLIGVVLWGTISGAMLPILLKKVGFDPASASTPFVATLVDVTGLLIYFNIALYVLHGTLL